MKLSRFTQIGAIAAVAALTLTGCAANERNAPAPTGSPTSGSSEAPGGDTVAGTLVGGGASSQEVAIQTWAAGLLAGNPDFVVEYDPTGSGAGRESFQQGAVAFAGSDRAFKADEITAGPFQSCAEGSDLVELPTYISPIAIIFTLEGIESLNLDPKTLAGIFAGTVTKWNDPAIAATNEGVTLPDTAITPVHRADKSGTTGNFTDYLSAAAGDVWTHGSVEEWPITHGEAADKTSGVVNAVKSGQGAIGYVDASRAEGFGTVAVKVGDEFVPYSPEAAAAIVDASPAEEGRAATDLAIKLDRTSAEKGVYPVVLVSYLIGCAEYKDAEQAKLAKTFFGYVASADGQKAAQEKSGNAPISDALRAKVTAAIDAIK